MTVLDFCGAINETSSGRLSVHATGEKRGYVCLDGRPVCSVGWLRDILDVSGDALAYRYAGLIAAMLQSQL